MGWGWVGWGGVGLDGMGWGGRMGMGVAIMWMGWNDC